MSICKTCKFYHICKGRLYKTDNECARYKSIYSLQKRKELSKMGNIFGLKENHK